MKICDADIASVAGELPDWQIVAENLCMGTEDISDIEKNHTGDADKRTAFLRKWITRDGSEATYGKLCDVLKKLKKQGAAEKISAFAQRRYTEN